MITSLESKKGFFCKFFLSFFVYFRNCTFFWFYPFVKIEESSTYKIRHIMKSVYISISTMTGRKKGESLNIYETSLSLYLSTRKLKNIYLLHQRSIKTILRSKMKYDFDKLIICILYI